MTAAGTTPAGLRVCRLAELPERGAHLFAATIGGRAFRGLVLRVGDEILGYVDSCPHAGLPLGGERPPFVNRDGRHVACRWHGAIFETATGLSAGSRAQADRWPAGR